MVSRKPFIIHSFFKNIIVTLESLVSITQSVIITILAKVLLKLLQTKSKLSSSYWHSYLSPFGYVLTIEIRSKTPITKIRKPFLIIFEIIVIYFQWQPSVHHWSLNLLLNYSDFYVRHFLFVSGANIL